MWEHISCYVEFIPDMLVVAGRPPTHSIYHGRSLDYLLVVCACGCVVQPLMLTPLVSIDADTYHICGCVVHPHLLVVASLAALDWEGCSVGPCMLTGRRTLSCCSINTISSSTHPTICWSIDGTSSRWSAPHHSIHAARLVY